jgi:hypothetical protein
MLRKQVERGAMPPWFEANAPRHVSANDASLSEQTHDEMMIGYIEHLVPATLTP